MTDIDGGFFDSQCMFICDQLSLNILDVSDATLGILGLEKNDLIGTSFNELVSEAPSDISTILRALDHTSTFDKIWSITTASNERRFIQFSTLVITYQGKPAKLIVAHDLTPLLNNDIDHLISTPVGFQGFPLAEVEWKRNGEIIRWSEKATELFGWTEQDFFDNPQALESFIYHEDFDLVFGRLEEAFKKGQDSISIINRNVTKTGNVVYGEWYNSILYDSEGDVISIYSLVANVTDRMIAHKESEKIMQSYQDLFDSMTDAIYLLDENNKILIANQGFKTTYGYRFRDVVEKDQSILRAPGKFDSEMMEKIRMNAVHQTAQEFEVWSKKANGEVFLTEMLVNKGSYFGKDVLIIIERDISERRFAEVELLRREKFFSELFNTSPLAITFLNSHNEVELVNHGFENLFGYTLEEIKGLEIDRIIVPEGGLEEAKRLTNSPNAEKKQLVRVSKDGKLLEVIVYSVPVILDGKLEAKFGLYVDVTERQRAEETVLKSLKEKELLLAEVHHRVKNNLAVISGLLELQSYAVDDPNVKLVLNDSRLRIQSIALVHEKLYKNENLSDIAIEPYIMELIEGLQKSFKSVSFDVSFDYEIDPVNLIITQAIPCGLLINEIVTNAYKHAFEGRMEGRIRISFKMKKQVIKLSIKDDGVGIDNMQFSKSGPSLGMKLIRTISKQLRAETEIKSGEGTEFIFSFEKAYI